MLAPGVPPEQATPTCSRLAGKVCSPRYPRIKFRTQGPPCRLLFPQTLKRRGAGLDGPELELEEGPEEKLLRTLGGHRGAASPPPRICVSVGSGHTPATPQSRKLRLGE